MIDEDTKKQLAQMLVENEKTPAPQPAMNKMALEEPCPKCSNKTLERHFNLFSGSYGGAVLCLTDSCNYRESSYGFLGRTMFKVEPMPPGVESLYLDKDTDKE